LLHIPGNPRPRKVWH